MKRMNIGLKKVVTVSCIILFISFLFAAFILLPPRLRAQTALATVTGFSQPFGLAITPNSENVYVTNGGQGTVSVINTATHTINATVPVGIGPFGVDITPDGKYAYVTNGGSASVSVINTELNTVTATIIVGIGPYGLDISPDGKYVYVANFGTSTVSVISTTLNMVVETIRVGYNPQGVGVTPNGEYVFITNFAAATVSVISTATNTVIDTIHVECGPVDVEFTPDGDYAYVANSGSGSVSVIDTATNKVVERITEFAQPSGLALTHNGEYLYVTNLDNDMVSVVSTATNTVIANVVVGISPYDIVIMPDDKYAYVVDYYSATVSVINLLPSVSVSPSHRIINSGQPEIFTAEPSGGSGSYKSYQWYVNGSAQPDAKASIFKFIPDLNNSYLITATVTDSSNATSAQSTATIVELNLTNCSVTPKPTTASSLAKLTPSDLFLIPEYNGAINFEVNGTYTSTKFANNMWSFRDLRLDGSEALRNLQVSTRNSTVTINSYLKIQNSTFQSERLQYAVDNKFEQILYFSLDSEPEGLETNCKWNIINNNISLSEGKDWHILHNGTIIVNGASGEVVIERWELGDFFSNGEAYANLPLLQQHSVSITIGIALVIVVIVAVLIKVKTRR